MNRTKSRIDLEERTMAFGLSTLKMLREVPVGVELKNIRRQLTHSATSVGALYREANRADSRVDYLNRLIAAQKEMVAAEYWLGLIKGLKSDLPRVSMVHGEAVELLAIFCQLRRIAEKGRKGSR